MRRTAAHISGNRRALRRAAAGAVASGDRHRTAYLDGARAGRFAEPGTQVRFAALVHDLGKGTTPQEEWPSHRGHEERSVSLIEALGDRLRLPGEYRDLEHHRGALSRRSSTAPSNCGPRPSCEFMERADAFRRPERFAQALLACEADSRGRAGLQNAPYPQREYLRAARDAAAAIKPTAQDIAAHTGAQIAERLHQRRTEAIAALRERSVTARERE